MVKLTLNEKELEELESILVEIPYKYVQPVLGYLQGKIQEQQAAANLEAQKPAPPEKATTAEKSPVPSDE